MKTSRLSRRLSFFRFYSTVSSISLSKSAKLSGINSSAPNNIDQIWELKTVRLKNPKNVMTINLNINSISGKFNQLKCLIQNHVDILVLTETKLDDETFTTSSFLIDGFSSPFWLYQNRKGSGILTYMRGYISSKSLTKHNFPNDIEGFLEKLNYFSEHITHPLKTINIILNVLIKLYFNGINFRGDEFSRISRILVLSAKISPRENLERAIRENWSPRKI